MGVGKIHGKNMELRYAVHHSNKKQLHPNDEAAPVLIHQTAKK